MPDNANDKRPVLEYATPPGYPPPQASAQNKVHVPEKPWLKGSVYTAVGTLLIYAFSTLIAILLGNTPTVRAVTALLMLSIWVWLVLIKIFLAQANSDRKHHAKAMSLGLAFALLLLAGVWITTSINGCIEVEQKKSRYHGP